MKKFFIAAALAAALAPALAQNENALNQSATGTAVNAGVTVNSYASPYNIGRLNNDIHTNQAAGTPPAYSTPAVIGTCATAGWGVSAQAVGGGASIAGKGGIDPGCDLVRDLGILEKIGATPSVMQKRACQKVEIRDAIEATGGSCGPLNREQLAAHNASEQRAFVLSEDKLIRDRQLAHMMAN